MNLEIRTAQLQDLEILTKIENTCFPPEEAANVEKIKSRIEKFANHFFVLLEDNQAIGFINGMVSESPILTDTMFENVSLHDENGSYQMILSLAVLPEFQGKGYGMSLLKQMISSAKAQHRKGITLTCKEKLVNFYAKAGFSNQGKSSSEHGGSEWYEMRLIF